MPDLDVDLIFEDLAYSTQRVDFIIPDFPVLVDESPFLSDCHRLYEQLTESLDDKLSVYGLMYYIKAVNRYEEVLRTKVPDGKFGSVSRRVEIHSESLEDPIFKWYVHLAEYIG